MSPQHGFDENTMRQISARHSLAMGHIREEHA